MNVKRNVNMKNPFVEIRKQRIQEIKELIRKEQPIKNKRLMALVAVEIGTTEKTTLGMIRALHDADFIEWNGKDDSWSIKEA